MKIRVQGVCDISNVGLWTIGAWTLKYSKNAKQNLRILCFEGQGKCDRTSPASRKPCNLIEKLVISASSVFGGSSESSPGKARVTESDSAVPVPEREDASVVPRTLLPPLPDSVSLRSRSTKASFVKGDKKFVSDTHQKGSSSDANMEFRLSWAVSVPSNPRESVEPSPKPRRLNDACSESK